MKVEGQPSTADDGHITVPRIGNSKSMPDRLDGTAAGTTPDVNGWDEERQDRGSKDTSSTASTYNGPLDPAPEPPAEDEDDRDRADALFGGGDDEWGDNGKHDAIVREGDGDLPAPRPGMMRRGSSVFQIVLGPQEAPKNSLTSQKYRSTSLGKSFRESVSFRGTKGVSVDVSEHTEHRIKNVLCCFVFTLFAIGLLWLMLKDGNRAQKSPL